MGKQKEQHKEDPEAGKLVRDGNRILAVFHQEEEKPAAEGEGKEEEKEKAE